MGHARGFYRPSRHHRAFHDLGTESVNALDREPHVNFRGSFRHTNSQDQLNLEAMPLVLCCRHHRDRNWHQRL